MAIDILNKEGKKVSTLDISGGPFDARVNEGLIYEIVKMQRANRRSGNASTKTRAEVSGSGAKPWRQKGTGRARSGEKRSPVWRHGGVVFGPHPRDYSYKQPKKAVLGAVKSALAYKIKESKMNLIETFELKEPKTKLATALFEAMKFKSALVIADNPGKNELLATRNLKDYKLLDVKHINAYDILKYDGLVMTKQAFEKFESLVKGKA
ncbi:MAG: 50S ribosomal protein L4 [Deltaproteobacteria bacterium]|nr:50S ribosomal protein L4 [Deltaproteobacteria bacterium]